MATQVVWVEIPAQNIERALAFYKQVFGYSGDIEVADDGVRKTAVLDGGANGAPGFSLNQTANFEPRDNGVYVYFDVGADVQGALNRVTAAGGKALSGKLSMGEAGYYATIRDTEGNIIGEYSTPDGQ